MFTALRGGPLWATVTVVVSVLGAATALVVTGHLSGSDWLAVATPILSGAAAIGGAHVVASATAQQQGSTPDPGTVTSGPPRPGLGVGVNAVPPAA